MSALRSRRLPAALGVLAATALASAGCAFRRDPPPDADGATIYAFQLCANCHADDARGTSRGPDLAGLAEHWDVEGLAAFLADPEEAVEGDERLARLARESSSTMRSYANLSLEQRRVLARWLLDPGRVDR